MLLTPLLLLVLPLPAPTECNAEGVPGSPLRVEEERRWLGTETKAEDPLLVGLPDAGAATPTPAAPAGTVDEGATAAAYPPNPWAAVLVTGMAGTAMGATAVRGAGNGDA